MLLLHDKDQHSKTIRSQVVPAGSSVTSPKFGGPKCLILGE